MALDSSSTYCTTVCSCSKLVHAPLMLVISGLSLWFLRGLHLEGCEHLLAPQSDSVLHQVHAGHLTPDERWLQPSLHIVLTVGGQWYTPLWRVSMRVSVEKPTVLN